MKRITPLLICILLTACSTPFQQQEEDVAAINPDPNHTHADFAVYINGERFDFSDPKYMSNPPQETDQQSLLPTLLLSKAYAHEGAEGEHAKGREYLHLHDGNGNVIHRHKPGLTLDDFFVSIGFHMTQQCFVLDDGSEVCPQNGKKWQMFVNEQEIPWNPAYVFEDLDRILLTYGATDEQIQEQLSVLSDDACLYSKTCPERGDPPEENCIADPAIPCVAPLEDL